MTLWAYLRRRLRRALGMQQGAAFQQRAGRRRHFVLTTPSAHPLAEEYRLLGATLGATLREVRGCWLRQVREHHPDRHAHDPVRHAAATHHTRQLNAAYHRIRQAHTPADPGPS